MIITLLLLLQFKHLVVDWILQPPYMWQNKGTYGHPGGILHAGFNALGTAIAFYIVGTTPLVFLAILLIDGILHYHIDYAKMRLNKVMSWGPTTHPEFWWLTGFDQFLHQITYLGLVYLFVVA